MTKGSKIFPQLEMSQEALQALLEKVKAQQAMTEQDFIVHALKDMMDGWVPLEVYLKMFPTETPNKVHKRVHTGAWIRQVHFAAPKGGASWVHLPAIRAWLEGTLTGGWCCPNGKALQLWNQRCSACRAGTHTA